MRLPPAVEYKLPNKLSAGCIQAVQQALLASRFKRMTILTALDGSCQVRPGSLGQRAGLTKQFTSHYEGASEVGFQNPGAWSIVSYCVRGRKTGPRLAFSKKVCKIKQRLLILTNCGDQG